MSNALVSILGIAMMSLGFQVEDKLFRGILVVVGVILYVNGRLMGSML